MSLDIDPLEIKFDLAETEPTTVLKLTNNSDKQKAFKVKTTMPKRYLVRPNQDIIEPGGHMDVRISLQAKEASLIKQSYRDDPEQPVDSRDKFLIQSIELKEEFLLNIEKERSAEDQKPMSDLLAPLWKDAKLQDLNSMRIKCTFKPPEDSMNEKTGSTDDVIELRRKYNDLLTFTLQLTSEKERLQSSYEEVSKELTEVKKRQSGGTGGSTTVLNSRQGFSWWQVFLVAIVAFILPFFWVKI